MTPALAHLHMPHTAALTAMHIGLGAVRAGECNLRLRGFSAGSYTGAAVAIAWHERQQRPSCKGDFFPIEARLGGIAMPRAMLRYILESEPRYAIRGINFVSFGPKRQARLRATREGARLYFFPEAGTLGNGGHSYGHFLDSDELFRLTPGDYLYSELTKRICGLADPYLDRAVRASLMGVACASVQLTGRASAFVRDLLGKRVTRPAMEWFLQVSPPSPSSILELRVTCAEALLRELKPHVHDLPLPFQDLVPTMQLVLEMWLPHLALERLIDMLGYQFLAMASEAEVEEEPSEQYHFPQQATVKRAATPAPVKPGANTWPIQLLHRIYPKATLIQVTPDLAGVPETRRCGLPLRVKCRPEGPPCWSPCRRKERTPPFLGSSLSSLPLKS